MSNKKKYDRQGKKQSKLVKRKYYAIKEGKGVENLIVRTWQECKELVHGYDSIYKSFNKLEDAKKYLEEVEVDEVRKKKKYAVNQKLISRKSTKHINGFRVSNEMYADLENKSKEGGTTIEDVIKIAINKYIY